MRVYRAFALSERLSVTPLLNRGDFAACCSKDAFSFLLAAIHAGIGDIRVKYMVHECLMYNYPENALWYLLLFLRVRVAFAPNAKSCIEFRLTDVHIIWDSQFSFVFCPLHSSFFLRAWALQVYQHGFCSDFGPFQLPVKLFKRRIIIAITSFVVVCCLLFVCLFLYIFDDGSIQH